MRFAGTAHRYGRDVDTDVFRASYIVDGDFDPTERERVGLAIEQWNHVLNGFVRFRTYPCRQILRAGACSRSSDPAAGS